MHLLTAEEERFSSHKPNDTPSATWKLSDVMNTAWGMGTFWYSLALSSPTGLFAVFDKELQPRFTEKCPDHNAFHEIMPWYWAKDIVSILTLKLADRKDYDIRLRQAFEQDILPR